MLMVHKTLNYADLNISNNRADETKQRFTQFVTPNKRNSVPRSTTSMANKEADKILMLVQKHYKPYQHSHIYIISKLNFVNKHIMKQRCFLT